jgi:pimeloyl-ACP methyl ester carboxylesterase
MRVRANGLEIECEVSGDDDDAAAVLLILGLGGHLTSWPTWLIRGLEERGYCPVRYDQRDVGLSTKLEEAGPPDLVAIAAAVREGRPPEVAYDLDDMAADAAGLLDGLGIAQVHLLGLSLGGMVAQQLAAAHPQRVLSLTSIMSTTGNPAVPPPTEAANEAVRSSPAGTDLEALVEDRLRAARVTGSPGYPLDEDLLRAS